MSSRSAPHATTAPISIETLRAIELTDQDGHPVALREALGRIVVLSFVFTGCDVCPTQTADLAAVQAHLPPDLRDHVLFLSISIDPEHDFPAAMRAFAEARDVDFSNWRFLTGTPDAIHRIDDIYGALPPNAPPGSTRHATTVQLFAPQWPKRYALRRRPIGRQAPHRRPRHPIPHRPLSRAPSPYGTYGLTATLRSRCPPPRTSTASTAPPMANPATGRDGNEVAGRVANGYRLIDAAGNLATR